MQSRDANDLEANIKRAFSAHADAVVLLVDHTKIGKHQLYMSAPMSAINYIVTDKDLIKIKVNMLKQMHEVMLNMNDERYYEEWIVLGMPDEPNEDDFESVAENPEKWVETVNFFAKLTADNEMERYEEY